MGVTSGEFYDQSKIAIVPMGFCFPGQDAKGGDLPPRPECAKAWRAKLFVAMPQIELVLAIGQYAQRWHLGDDARKGLTATVARFRDLASGGPGRPRCIALPHPSWRNNAWLKAHPWFEAEVLPMLRADVKALLSRVPNGS